MIGPMIQRYLLRTGLFACLAVVGVFLLACGSDSDDEEPTPTSGGELPVIAKEFEFLPIEQRVEAGDVVVQFENQGEERHTYSIYRDAAYEDLVDTTTGVNPGSRTELELSLEPGEYFVRCDLHPTEMQASLTAEEAD